MHKPRRLVIIPARAGSKRIPNKNIYKIANKPIILHSLEILIESELFDTILVSSDSPEILEICKPLGVNASKLRPDYLSTDEATLAEVLQYEAKTIKDQGETFDEIWFYSATACLLEKTDLVNAAERFRNEYKMDPVLSVIRSPTPVEWALELNQFNRLIPRFPSALTINSQNFSDTYFDAGCFAIFNAEMLLDKEIDIEIIQFSPHILPRFKAIDVDNLDDMLLVSRLFEQKILLKESSGYRKNEV